jgi:hypothetical protein
MILGATDLKTTDLSAERKTTSRAASVPVGRRENSRLGKSRRLIHDTCRIDGRHVSQSLYGRRNKVSTHIHVVCPEVSQADAI